jgi:hypothetical protein
VIFGEVAPISSSCEPMILPMVWLPSVLGLIAFALHVTLLLIDLIVVSIMKSQHFKGSYCSPVEPLLGQDADRR